MAEIERLLGGSQQQHVTISGNAAGLMVSLVAVLAIVTAVAVVVVVAVMRDRDVADMGQIRNRLGTLEQYRDQHARRLTELETKPNGVKANVCEGR
jgi:type II secretory pathway pseudopilin PulG